jgi:hypothetical protein
MSSFPKKPSFSSLGSQFVSKLFTKKPIESEEEKKRKEENQRKKSRELYNKKQKEEQNARRLREMENARRLRSPALLGRNIAIEEGRMNDSKQLTNYLVNKAANKEVKKRENKNFQQIIRNRNSKDNENKNYILNKLEFHNYDLLYILINNLFDKKLSDKSRTKFEEYWEDLMQEEKNLKEEEDNLKEEEDNLKKEKNKLKKEEDKLEKEEDDKVLLEIKEKIQKIIDKRIKIRETKKEIIKILKSVYRLKYNKSIEKERKEKIIGNLKIINRLEKISKSENLKKTLNNEVKESKNRLLSNVKDISSSIDLATSFHNFSKKTYYICNAGQLKKINNTNTIESISIGKINELSPLYYENGICCFNPLIRTYINGTEGLKEGLKNVSSKNKSQEYGIEMIEETKQNNKKKYIDLIPIIANIEKYNNKNSILSKFFDKHILGIPDEYGIKENNKKNTKEINSKNFDRFSDELGSYIDTIIVVENGEITYVHTKTEKSDGTKIFESYLKIKSGGGNKQVGGLDVFSIVALICIVIGFFVSLRICYDRNDKENTTIVKILGYSYCVAVATFSIALGFLSALFYLSTGPIGETGAGVVALIIIPTILLLPFNPRLLRFMSSVPNNSKNPNPRGKINIKSRKNNQPPPASNYLNPEELKSYP